MVRVFLLFYLFIYLLLLWLPHRSRTNRPVFLLCSLGRRRTCGCGGDRCFLAVLFIMQMIFFCGLS